MEASCPEEVSVTTRSGKALLRYLRRSRLGHHFCDVAASDLRLPHSLCQSLEHGVVYPIQQLSILI